jgi:alpha-L-fucosidase
MVGRRSFLAGAGALGLAQAAGATDIAKGPARKTLGEMERVTLLGGGAVRHRHDERGPHLDLPHGSTGEFVPVMRIDGRGLL